MLWSVTELEQIAEPGGGETDPCPRVRARGEEGQGSGVVRLLEP